jgi:hypothetical protein
VPTHEVKSQTANIAIFRSKPQMWIAALFWESEFLRLPVETVSKLKSSKLTVQHVFWLIFQILNDLAVQNLAHGYNAPNLGIAIS